MLNKQFFAGVLMGLVFVNQVHANALLPTGGGIVTLTGSVANPSDATDGNSNPALMAGHDNEVVGDVYWLYSKVTQDIQAAPLGSTFLRFNGPRTTFKQPGKLRNIYPAFFGGNYRVNDRLTVGFSGLAGGTISKFHRSPIVPAGFPNSDADKTLIFKAIATGLNIAYKSCEDAWYGINVILARSTLQADGTTFSANSVRTRGDGRVDSAVGAGVRIGGYWKLNDILSFGASVSTPIWFSKMGKYRDISRHAPNIPPIIRLGVAIKLMPKLIWTADISEFFWGKMAAYGKPVNEGGFNWENTHSFGTSFRYQALDCLKLILGYGYSGSPVDDSEVLRSSLFFSNVFVEHQFTLSAIYSVTKSLDLRMTGAYAIPVTRIDDGSGSRGIAARGYSITARQAIIGMGLRWKFGQTEDA